MLNQQPNEIEQPKSVEKKSDIYQNNTTDWQKIDNTYQQTTEDQRLKLNNLIAKAGNETWTNDVRSGNSAIQESEIKIGYIHNQTKKNSGAKFLEKQKNILIEKIEIPKLLTKNGLLEYNFKKYNKQIENSIRIWPQHTNLEGFFICKIKKL